MNAVLIVFAFLIVAAIVILAVDRYGLHGKVDEARADADEAVRRVAALDADIETGWPYLHHHGHPEPQRDPLSDTLPETHALAVGQQQAEDTANARIADADFAHDLAIVWNGIHDFRAMLDGSPTGAAHARPVAVQDGRTRAVTTTEAAHAQSGVSSQTELGDA